MSVTINGTTGVSKVNDLSVVYDSELAGQVAPQLMGFKNYIINGNFDVWQYATSQTSSDYGSDDRWSNGHIGSTKTHSQVICTDTERALFNASYFSRTVVTSVAGAGNLVYKYQGIENITKLSGKTVTLSFWAKADSNKNIAIELVQAFGTGGTPSGDVQGIGAQQIALTTTWQKKTVTITVPSIVGKTLGTDGFHTTKTSLVIWFDAGSNYNSRTASLGQQSGTFDIAQVQIEEGSVATPFEQRPYALELSLCQRYFLNLTDVYVGQLQGGASVTDIWFPTVMRVIPSLTHNVTGLGTVIFKPYYLSCYSTVNNGYFMKFSAEL